MSIINVKVADEKQVQLKINTLTQEQYDKLSEISSIQLSTELSDQLFLTPDTGSGGGNADIIYMSPEEYKMSADAHMLDEDKYYATSAVGGSFDPSVISNYAQLSDLSNYAALSGGNHISGNNDISVLNIIQTLSAANSFSEEDSLEDKSLIMTDETGSYNVNYSQLESDKIGSLGMIRVAIVESLPTTLDPNIFYFVKEA